MNPELRHKIILLFMGTLSDAELTKVTMLGLKELEDEILSSQQALDNARTHPLCDIPELNDILFDSLSSYIKDKQEWKDSVMNYVNERLQQA